jgi:ribonuclease BN (tRNA processing enzyme)
MVDVGDDLIVIDHGPGSHHRLIESGRKPTDVSHAFFTHLHYDHCLDYPRLLLQRWDQGAGTSSELKVFGPPPIAHMTERIIGSDGAFACDIRARIEHPTSRSVYESRGGTAERQPPRPMVREIDDGDTIAGEGWIMTAGPARHMQPYLQCHSYRLESADSRVCFGGDSGGVFEPLIEFARGCDTLVHMCHLRSQDAPSETYRRTIGSHLDCAEVANRAGVGTLVLTHLTPHLDRPGIRESMTVEISAVFQGNIIWAEDLMVLPTGDRSSKVD